MTICPHPHDPRTQRCRRCTQLNRSQEALRRRQLVLNALRPGKWVHGTKLEALAYPGMAKGNLKSLIHRMRREGYEIEGERKGLASRGYRLIAEPQQPA
jgi:biotin operon repressor